jgi:hypothetical protein
MRSQPYETVAALQADLDAWLHYYNHERTRLGYRNQGAVRGRPSSSSSASHPQNKEVKKRYRRFCALILHGVGAREGAPYPSY